MELSRAWPTVRALRRQVGEALGQLPDRGANRRDDDGLGAGGERHQVRRAGAGGSAHLVLSRPRPGSAADRGRQWIDASDGPRELRACVESHLPSSEPSSALPGPAPPVSARAPPRAGGWGSIASPTRAASILQCTCVDGVVIVVATRKILITCLWVGSSTRDSRLTLTKLGRRASDRLERGERLAKPADVFSTPSCRGWRRR